MDVAIVGAGVAGAGVASALRAADVTVYEETSGVGGRAATRRRDGCRYDCGANYVKDGDPRVTELVTEVFGKGLIDVEEPIHVFDADGTIRPGRRADDHKWTWGAGIAALAERLFARADAEVVLETRVDELARVEGPSDGETAGGTRWRLAGGGTALGTFDAVVLTPPAPRTAALLESTDAAASVRTALADAAADVDFRTTVTAVLHYPFELERPWYALLNADREHDVGWIAREECKDGHVPAGESLLVVQMAPGWSSEHYGDPPDEQAAAAAALVAALLEDERLADPDWTDWKGWRDAQPDSPFEAPAARERAEDDGLYLAGDWLAGEGRVHLALGEGLDVGARVA